MSSDRGNSREGFHIHAGSMIMKNDNTQANHRGSSPPFQDPEQDFVKWLYGLKSIGQRDETTSMNQRIQQPGNRSTKPTDLNEGSGGQDDGGESGGGV